MDETTPQARRIVRFGVYEVDLRAGELRKHGVKIKLQEQPFQILAMLLERHGEVVTREELPQNLWPADTFVDFEHSINAAVKRLRKALDDSADSPRFVETLPRRGYRFIAPVEALEGGVGAAAAPTAVPGRMRIAALVLAGLVIAFGYFAWRRFWPRVKLPTGKIMRVVLPFENLSGDPTQDYFADGLTEEMITQLAGLQPERLGVIARTSAMRYKHTQKRVDEIGRELGVDYLLEGSVRREGERVRISAQLIQVSDQAHLWAESYDRDLGSILASQGEVARSIANEIELELTPPQQARLAYARPVIPEAHEAYLRGRYHWNKRTPEEVQKGLEYFNQAIEKDPRYALAYAGVADYYTVGSGGYLGLSPKEAYPKAKAAALKALEIDDSVAETHTSLATVKMEYDWDWAGAEQEFKRALELNPNYAIGHQWYAEFLRAVGRRDESFREMQRVLELDPFSVIVNNSHGIGFLYARQYDRAVQQCRRTLELEPDFLSAQGCIVWSRYYSGLVEEAFQEQLRLDKMAGASPAQMAALRKAYEAGGWNGVRRLWLDRQKEAMSKGKCVSPVSHAGTYAQLGDKGQAMVWLEKGLKQRDVRMAYLKIDPEFDPLRSDPRFQDLLRRMNFPH